MSQAKYLKILALAIVTVQPLFGCALARQPATDAGKQDSTIRANVQALIEPHPDLLAPNLIYVDVEEHVVYLSGKVNTELTIANAEALAGQVPGVERVVSSIGLDN